MDIQTKSPRVIILLNFLNSDKGDSELSILFQLTWTWSILPLSRMWTKKNLEPKRRTCITRPESLLVTMRIGFPCYDLKHTSHSHTVADGAQFLLALSTIGLPEIVSAHSLLFLCRPGISKTARLLEPHNTVRNKSAALFGSVLLYGRCPNSASRLPPPTAGSYACACQLIERQVGRAS